MIKLYLLLLKMPPPNGVSTFSTGLHIEAVQTVVPVKPTDPRQSRGVSVAENMRSNIFQRHLHVVLYYKKASEEDSGWLVAGWFKESLGYAVLEQPILAGRIQKRNDERELKVVSTDSGIRLVEARIAANLSEFLDLKDKREEEEARLVFWADVDEREPKFSPLFYVVLCSITPTTEVTNFKCRAHAIGISCSLLLADTVSMANFLKRWANIIHNRLTVSITEIPQTLTFYLPNLRKIGCSSLYPGGSVTSKNSGQSVIFNFASKGLILDSEMQTTLAALCIEAAERSFATKMASKFSLMIKESLKDAFTIENYAKQELITRDSSILRGLTCVSWEDLGGDEICLNEGNKPTNVSYWISSGCGEGLGRLLMATSLQVLYYKKAFEEDSGWFVTGWFKESLGNVMLEQPILAGRIQKGHNERELKIVSTDSGIRLVEARIEANLSEFLYLEDKKEEEAQLVFWEDIDEQNPQFSPLFFVQVTNFKCEGYAVGISCSLLLAGPVAMVNFLKRWAYIHRFMVSMTEIPRTPTFYLPNLRKIGCSSPYPGRSVTSKNSGQSVIFKFASSGLSLDIEMQKTLAALCIEEAERSFATKMASKLALTIKESFKDAFTIENYAKEELVAHDSSIVNGLTCVSWEDLGGDEICLNEGNKPASVSHWISSGCGGLVMVIPSHNDGVVEGGSKSPLGTRRRNNLYSLEGYKKGTTDSGIRLVEARIEANLSEFLDVKDKKKEAQLVFWEDIDEQNPQFLHYFLFSLLLSDPVSMANFLKRWANIHNRLTGLSLDTQMQRTLAVLCAEAAERSFATKMASKLALIIKESFKDVFTIENYAKEELVTHDSSIVSGLTCVSWEDLGGDEICLNEGNKPASVSYWISSGCGEGLVMVIPSDNDGVVDVNMLVAS
ncbi:hypothetical protein RJ639_038278 [Escallonia herrerae]|uniref:Uncharacterized protein n=1 Tax=Escallonia herrerae TaxID=1293975 RepID=A0AA88WN31_9ASTE|nr:hypothetical protein RJ639_038278 [Escallonia herrerae]